MPKSLSEQTKQEALNIAKGIQKPGQKKEQTKIISQGIEKGIAEYKKQQKAKARDADKHRKLELKAKQKAEELALAHANQQDVQKQKNQKGSAISRYLPWALLVISWAGFAAYALTTNASLASL